VDVTDFIIGQVKNSNHLLFYLRIVSGASQIVKGLKAGLEKVVKLEIE
jgi:hypothetical protein